MPSIREQVAAIINRDFPHWEVSAADVVPVTGYWKSQDVYRWEVHPTAKATGERVRYHGCWETMKEFIRHARKNGCYVSEKHYEIQAHEQPKG